MKTWKPYALSIMIWAILLMSFSAKAQEASLDFFHERRQQLIQQMEDGAIAVMMSAEKKIRSNDIHYPFRQRSSFYYLTGYKHPESAFIIQPNQENEFIMFLPSKDSIGVMWRQQEYGLTEAMKVFGADTAYDIEKFEKTFRQKLWSESIVYMDPNDQPLKDLFDKIQDKKLLVNSLDEIRNINNLINDMRLQKDSLEISQMKKAIDITGQAHLEAMKAVHPGMYEYEVEALVEYVFQKNGASDPAFSSIVGSGNNANTLHYMKNDRKMKAGELVLMDIGAEYNMYAADLTRTIPVDGEYSRKQEDIYQLVLKAIQKAAPELESGKGIFEAHYKATDVIMKGLYELGLVTDPDSKWQRNFYIHYTASHWLGLDVHDLVPKKGLYGKGGIKVYQEPGVNSHIKGRILKPGMVFTFEPGIYLPENGLERIRALKGKKVPAEKIEAFLDEVGPVYRKYRGIGIRIEEDVLITEDGHEVLSRQLPRSIDAIEKIMDQSSDYVSKDQ